jgi:hypothetical protein
VEGKMVAERLLSGLLIALGLTAIVIETSIFFWARPIPAT